LPLNTTDTNESARAGLPPRSATARLAAKSPGEAVVEVDEVIVELWDVTEFGLSRTAEDHQEPRDCYQPPLAGPIRPEPDGYAGRRRVALGD